MPRKSWSRLKRRPRMYVPTAGCARLCCVCGTGPVRITGRCLLQYLGQGTGKRRYVSGTSGCRPPRCPLRTPRCRSGTRHCTGRRAGGTEPLGSRGASAIREPRSRGPAWRTAPLGARLHCAAPHRTAQSCRARFRSSRATTGPDAAGVASASSGRGRAGAPARRSSADVTTPPPAA